MGAAPSQPGKLPDTAHEPVPVTLHIYDVWTAAEVRAVNKVLRAMGTGAFHCGVEIYGTEWSYRGNYGGTGVFSCPPTRCEEHTFCESVAMGRSCLREREVERLIRVLQKDWSGLGYDILRRNCCHFCNKLCRCLGVGQIPGWITSLASAGDAVREAGRSLEEGCRTMPDLVVGACQDPASCCSVDVRGAGRRAGGAAPPPAPVRPRRAAAAAPEPRAPEGLFALSMCGVQGAACGVVGAGKA